MSTIENLKTFGESLLSRPLTHTATDVTYILRNISLVISFKLQLGLPPELLR